MWMHVGASKANSSVSPAAFEASPAGPSSAQELVDVLLAKGPSLVTREGAGLDAAGLRSVVAAGAENIRGALAGVSRPVCVVSGDDSAAELVAILSAFAAGAVPLPVPAHLPAAELGALLADVGAAAVLDGAWHLGQGQVRDTGVRRAPLPEGVALLLSTSGSSGAPRRVMLGAAGILANVDAILDYLPIEAFGTTGIVLPFCYSYALIGQAFTTLRAGGQVVLLNDTPFVTAQIEGAVGHGVTGLSSVATSLRRLAAVALDLPEAERPRVGYLACAGGPLPKSVAESMAAAFPGALLFSQYGLTEASPRVAALRSDDPRFGQPGAAGFPLRGVRIEIRSAEGQLLPAGVRGQVWVRTPSAMLGYLDDAEATAARLQGGALRTGDLGHLDADGCLWLAGRSDDLVKIRGERVSLDRVAEALSALLAGERVDVLCTHDADGEATLVALVESLGVEQSTLRRRARSLPAAYRPGRWVTMPVLPSLPSGKPDRKALRALVTEEPLGAVG